MINEKMKMFFSYLPLALIMLGLFFINFHRTISTYIVFSQSIPVKMYFTGVVKPIKTVNVDSAFDGYIKQIVVSFDTYVKKGDVLFLIQSDSLEKDFRSVLENYFKTKALYQYTLFQNRGNNELYKAGLISKIEFLDSESQLKNSQLALWDAERELKNVLMSTGVSLQEVQNLSSDNMDKLHEILSRNVSGVKIVAPESGVLLFSNAGQSGPDETQDIKQGSKVKKDQVLAVIADTTGLNFEVKVNETNFNDITIGQEATITGVAFPSIVLKGYVESIDRQVSNSGFGNVPTYNINIVVPKLTAKEQRVIQIGMSAEITLTKKTPTRIHVPISAITQTDNGYVVKVINPQNRQPQEVIIVPGDTTNDTVEVLSGLTPGDEIVISN